MTKMTNKRVKSQIRLQKLTDELNKYDLLIRKFNKELRMDDGIIDADEQAFLDDLAIKLSKIRNRTTRLQMNLNTPDYDDSQLQPKKGDIPAADTVQNYTLPNSNNQYDSDVYTSNDNPPASKGLQASVGKKGINNHDDVQLIQQLLNDANFLPKKLNPDGRYGKNTLNAIIAYQRNFMSFAPDGLISVGGSTWKKLNSNATIAPPEGNKSGNDIDSTYSSSDGEDAYTPDNAQTENNTPAPATSKLQASVGKKGINNHDDVQLIQQLLNDANFLPKKLNPDGRYGKNTLNAIIAYQRGFMSFAPDGLIGVGGSTWKKLNSSTPLAAPEGNKSGNDGRSTKITASAFNSQIYAIKNHKPSTGIGLFDASLDPKDNILKIVLRVSFTFINGASLNLVDLNKTGQMSATEFDLWKKEESASWTASDIAEWKAGYIDAVSNAWDGYYLFSHPNLDNQVSVDVDVVENASKWHFNLKVTKIPAGSFKSSGVGNAEKIARLDSEDLNPAYKGGNEHQIGAIHESGHMLGLGDEYDDEKVGISHSALVQDALGTIIVEGKHDSIMSVGATIEKEQYVTFLETLKKITKLQEWEFIG